MKTSRVEASKVSKKRIKSEGMEVTLDEIELIELLLFASSIIMYSLQLKH